MTSSSSPRRHGVGTNQYQKKGVSKRRERHAQLAAATASSKTPPVPASEVAQCGYEFVAAGASGAGYRQCKNAVRVRAGTGSAASTMCHQHGGSPGDSFGGKTVAKARAEAERGELHMPPPEFWEGAEARYEVLQGQVAEMYRRDPERLAALVNGAARMQAAQSRESGVGRFSVSNQLLVACAHYEAARREGMSPDDALEAAVARMGQPHMTAKRWAEHGRHPDGEPVAVIHFQPASYLKREPDETEEEFAQRARRARGHSTVLLQYPLDATHGAPYGAAPDPMAQLNASIRPRATDEEIEESINRLGTWCEERGYRVEWVGERPRPGGREVDGYWDPAASRIVLWKGAGGGSPAARLHLAGHEAGHAMMSHGLCASAQHTRPDAEQAAETFAYLVSDRCGVESGDASRVYIGTWQERAGVRGEAASLASVRSAVVAADQLFATFEPAVSRAAPVDA